MKLLSWEQRFKNYIDEKYHFYDNADEAFYHNLMGDPERQKYLDLQNKLQEERRLESVRRGRAKIEETKQAILKVKQDHAENK